MEQGEATTQLPGFDITRQLILGELDTEIRVRERLQEAVEARIAWATCLQSSLGAVAEKHGPADITSANPFQLAAADALDVAEAPLHPILSRQARFINRPTLDVAPASLPTSSTNPYARPHTRHTRLRRSPSTIRTPPKFLYFRDTTTDTIARLSCPDCTRGDFPRVQSLLNHCRIQHGREFGSHDDCIRGCAAQVPKDEEAWVIENGSELRQTGLPSLRRLFEIAVGSAGSPLGIASVTDASTRLPGVCQGGNCVPEGETSQAPIPIPPLSSTHLSRTLGHHAESPGLAPFLGRAPKRRGIMVHDENDPVEIDGGEQTLVRRQWHKPFIHRSRARPSLDVVIPAETLVPQCNPDVTPVVTQGTRFHIVARVTISDRSLWIPVDRRSDTPLDHTHQWWLSIGAPTYSLPLAAILERATVTCLSPGTSPIDEPIELSGPPFFAGGTTAQPFLARLRLEWTSESLNPPLEVDHWVELDMLHAGAPVLGDEQVLDVELDRHTVFLPVDEPAQGPDPWDLRHGSSRAQAEPAVAPPGYVVLLRSLAPKFPLTLRDMKTKSSAPLPYKIVSSPTHFRALVPGRRKAIEWARARAVREAYDEVREEQRPASDYPYLSTGDVFSWLADTGLSLHQAVLQSPPADAFSGKRTSERIKPSSITTFCTVCGLESAPRSVAQSSNSWEGTTSSGTCCHSFPLSRFPLLDLKPIISSALSQNRPNGPVQSTPDKKVSFPWSNREILAITDPTLTIAVRCIIAPLRLRCFSESNNTSISSAGVLHPTKSTAITPIVDEPDVHIARSDLDPISESLSMSLASSAVLALAVREFARRLVNSAATAFTSDRTRGAKGGTRAILTPAHVSVGVLGPFLTRDGVLQEFPPSPIALVLATPAVRCLPRDLSPPSDVMDISSCNDSVSGVDSSSRCKRDVDKV